MPKFISTSGKTKVAIGICARCSCKFPYSDLVPDPNYPALFVCPDDRDHLDPYRLPAREAERIDLDHPRPDVSLVVGSQSVPVGAITPVLNTSGGFTIDAGGGGVIAAGPPANPLTPSNPWVAGASYAAGNQVTPSVAVGFVAAGEEIWLFTCVLGGVSGATAPAWTSATGTLVADNEVIWINQGLYLP